MDTITEIFISRVAFAMETNIPYRNVVIITLSSGREEDQGQMIKCNSNRAEGMTGVADGGLQRYQSSNDMVLFLSGEN